MEPSSVPRLEGERGINSTLGSPRNFSKPFGSPASSPPRRDSPYVTLHEFLHAQHEALPLLDLSPNPAPRPLRRKSSRRDLSGDYSPANSHQASSRPLPRARSPDSQALLIPLPPSTPQQHPSAASPSLSSTITTLQSTPTQTPVAQPGPNLPSSGEAACRVLLEPLRVKRKFPGPKPPKRLPRRADDGGWLVLASVIGDREPVDHLQVQSVRVPERPRGGLAARGRRPESEGIKAKQDRSVRFAGIWSESDDGESTDRLAQGGGKDATGDSTYTLSKFKFPTPPGYARLGTFGNLSEPTPPTSPATLHYSGASFDLVNPHASLLLGTKEIETPAEIDGLLDNYFEISQDSLDMQYDPITGDSIAHRGSTPSSEDGSRRGRPLYSDLSIARNNIMRIPSQPAASGQLDTGVAYQESPLSHRSPPVSRPTLILAEDRSIAEGVSAMSTARSAAQPLPPAEEQAGTGEQSRSRSRGASTTGAPSTYSDPFDLNVSESEFEHSLRQEYFDNIDRMIQAGQPTGAGVPTNEGGLAGRDVGADAEAYAFRTERDTTITNIVDHYGYRSARDAQDDTISSVSVEQGRATAEEERRSTFMSNNPFLSANERRMAGAPQRLRSPPGLPPLVPAPTPAPQTARGAIQPDNTELPTSEQTYGATGELLGLTPAQIRRDPLATGNRDLEEAAIPPYIPRWDDDKENIPPVDEDEHIHAAHEMHAATHDDGAFGPPIRIGRPDFADAMRANNFRAFPSSSSWLNAQDVYEDETAEPAVARARATDRHAGHLAQPEYRHGTAAPHADYRRPDSGFDLEYHTTILAQASGTALQIRNRDNLNVVHSRVMERYESRGTVEDGSEWEDEDEPRSRPNLHSQQTHAPENRFSQATQGSYADTSDYEESRRGSVVPMPPANAHELDGSPLPPGRFHRADWPGRRLGLRMPFSDSEPEPGPVDKFEMVEFAKDVMRQKHNEQRSTGERAGLGESVRNERMRQNEVILERIRQTSRSTIRQAAAEFAAEAQEAQFLQPAIPRIPQHLQPGGDNCDSFRHVMEAAVQEDTKHVPRSTGLRYPFLTDQCTPQRPAGHLAWSETEHTFKTIYPQGSPVTPSLSAHCQGPYSPLPDPPEPAFTRARAGTEDTNRTGHDGFDELTPLTRSYPGKGRSRASVPGQTGLRPFLAALDDPAVNAASSSPTVSNPGRRLTDSEMAKRVKFWQPRPSVEPRKAHDLIREPIPASEEEGRRLLGVHQAYDPAAVRRHKLISGRLFNWCSLCPITALMFGFGSFDGLIANKMDGKVEGARQEDKHKARVVAAPASFVGWALVVLAVVLAVVFVKTARAL